jgi:hypothetical protein
MSRNGSYAKSMNGIVSFDDGDGTVIEGSELSTGIINCTTLNALSTVNSATVNTDFIGKKANSGITVLNDTTFNGKIYTDYIYAKNSSQLGIQNNTLITGTLATTQSIQTAYLEGRGIGGVGSPLNIGQSNELTSYVSIGRDAITAGGVVFPAIPVRTTYIPTSNYDIANKLYVDNATAGTNILGLSNTFTGAQNTFNNKIIVSNITYDTNTLSASPTTNVIDLFKTTTGDITIGSSGKVNLTDKFSFSGTVMSGTNTAGQYNIMSGVTTGIVRFGHEITTGIVAFGQAMTTGTVNFVSPVSGTSSAIMNIGNSMSSSGSVNICSSSSAAGNVNIGYSGTVKLCNSIIIKPNSIDTNTAGATISLFDTLTSGILHVGKNIVGGSGILNLCNSIFITPNSIASGQTSDVSLFNSIGGTIGKIRMATTLIISESSIISTSVTDAIKLFNNITTGSITMATNLVFKKGTIDTNNGSDTIDLFKSQTSGVLNIGTGLRTSTGIVNIGGVDSTTNMFGILKGTKTGIISGGNGVFNFEFASLDLRLVLCNYTIVIIATGALTQTLTLPLVLISSNQRVYIRTCKTGGSLNVNTSSGSMLFKGGTAAIPVTTRNLGTNTGFNIVCDGANWYEI